MDINVGYSIIASVGALLPDIDQPTSKIGNKVPGSFIIKLIFGHRGFFHSLLASVLLFLVLSTFVAEYIVILIVTGYLSHLVLDAFTPAGVPLLYPLQKRFSIPLAVTGGIIEYIFLSVMLIGSIFLFIY